jgi:hypothetical protein
LELDDAPIQLVDLGHREVLPKRSPRDGVEEEEEEQVDEEVSTFCYIHKLKARFCVL